MNSNRLAARVYRGLVAVAVLAASPIASSDDAGAARQSTLGLAERMIAACLQHAAAKNLPPLSVVVIDAGGTLIAFKRQDGAMPASSDAALLKARTAVRTNVPTSVIAPLVAADPPTRDAFVILQLSSIPGGVPFAQGDRGVAGAVGVSGAAPDQDAACAQLAVAAAADKDATGKR